MHSRLKDATRVGSLFALPPLARQADHHACHRVHFEPLEVRTMLAATVWVDDNWQNVTHPGVAPVLNDQVSNAFDTIAPGTIVKTYGVDAFGTIAGGLGSLPHIADAIGAVLNAGTVNILEGTYAESDIVLSKPVTVNGAGQTGPAQTRIVPEVASNKTSATNFGVVGTRQGFILNAINSTIQKLTIDGGVSADYHHGITTIYDLQNGANYSSLRNGTIAPTNFGSPDINTRLMVKDVTVTNSWYHGITISGAINNQIGSNRIQNVTVSEIGVSATEQEKRIGIQLQNNDGAEILFSTVTHAGVGMQSNIFGTPAGFGINGTVPRNRSGMRGNVVADVTSRAYSVSYGEDTLDLNYLYNPSFVFGGFADNEAHFTSANNATGLYLNFSQPVITGYRVDGAKIGIYVQNTTTVNLVRPMITSSVLIGPGTGTVGSIGILADNQGDSNRVVFDVTGGTSITGYATGIRVQQVTPQGSPNVAMLDHSTITGNALDLDIRNNSRVYGALNQLGSVSVTSDGYLQPGFLTSTTMAVAPGVYAGPSANIIASGNVSLTGVYSPVLSGANGSIPFYDFNGPQTYAPGELPDLPVDGTVATPNATSWAEGQVEQSGDGQLRWNVGALNGPLQLLYGQRSHIDPNDPDRYVLEPLDVSAMTTLNLVAKLQPDNQAQFMVFGLNDIVGHLALWMVPLSAFNANDYSTYSIDLLSPSYPFSLGPGGDFDLSKVVGFTVAADQGLINGNSNVPFGLILDDLSFGTISHSRLEVTGTVTLGGALVPQALAAFNPPIGSEVVLINNDGVDPVVGTFADLPEGSTTVISGKQYRVSYVGGTGNDVTLTPLFSSVSIAKRLFYNQSRFDGNNTQANTSDDAAIATDKSPYIPGSGTATFANISSYTRGINGIMIDLKGTHGTLTASDFIFKTGNNNTPSTWTTAPAPTSVVVRAGAGTSGSDRVELIWNAAGAVKNKWLQVIVRGNDSLGGQNVNTGLASSDVFFFGSRVADSGPSTAGISAVTNLSDDQSARNNTGAGATVTNLYDYDRNGFVQLADAQAARNNAGATLKINLTNPPAAPDVEAANSTADAGPLVAPALAAAAVSRRVEVPVWIQTRLDRVSWPSAGVARYLAHWAATWAEPDDLRRGRPKVPADADSKDICAAFFDRLLPLDMDL